MSALEAEVLPQPTRDAEQGMRDLREFGYCIHENLLTPAETAALRDRLDEQAEMERRQDVAWLGNGGRGGNTWIGGPREGEAAPWQGVRTLLNKGRVFVDLMMHPIVLGYMKGVFRGADFYLSSTNGLIIRKGAVPMATHTDQQFVPFPTPMPVACNIMVCLSDFDEDMGATRVVPRSHLQPPPQIVLDTDTMDGRNVDKIDTVPAVCRAGSAIVFESRLWHCSGASTSDKVRYSISTYYSLPFMRAQDNYPASMHDDVYEGLSDEERAMCGFKTGPFGRLDPRQPGDRTNTDLKGPYIPELRRDGHAKAVPVDQVGKFPSYHKPLTDPVA